MKEMTFPMSYWNGIRSGLYQLLEAVGDEGLTFRAKQDGWSVGEVAVHIAGAEDGWFRYVLRREVADWPPDILLKDHPTVKAVRELLERIHKETEEHLAAMEQDEWEQVIELPWGGKCTARWVTWHVLEHEIHHRGEISLMAGMLGREVPDV